jgi:hypothetical protein
MKKIPLALLMLLIAVPSFAADHYVCLGATGAGKGNTWTDAYTDFGTGAGQVDPNSLVRGDTYWVAAGTGYNAAATPLVFQPANSGTLLITIQAATDAAHGASSVGWTNGGAGTCHQGQATFNAPLRFYSNYITFTGVYRSTATGNPWQDWNLTSGYGFHIYNNNGSNVPLFIGGAIWIGNPNNPAVNHVTLDYLDVEGSHATDCSVYPDSGLYSWQQGGDQNDTIYIGHSNFHDMGTGEAIGPAGNNNFTAEYNWIWRLNANLPGGKCHSENWRPTGVAGTPMTNLIIRYNWTQGCSGTACLETVNSAPGNSNWQIYGNVFWDNTAEENMPLPTAGDGVLDIYNTFTGPLYIFNNTVSYINPAGKCNFPGLDANQNEFQNVYIENNLIYNCPQNFSPPSVSATGVYVWNYMSYYGSSYCTSGNCDYTNDTIATHKYGHNTNPFVNVANSMGADNFNLSADTDAGVSTHALLPGNDADMNGVARGASGIWSIGALQFSSGNLPPSPPSGLQAVVQ